MDYDKIYKALIAKRRSETLHRKDCYCECHHIIPFSISHDDDDGNKVLLTARGHYIAHLLLVKVYENEGGVNYSKMLYAVNRMMCVGDNDCVVSTERRRIRFNSRLYERFRERYREMVSEKMREIMSKRNPMKGKMWITNIYEEKQKLVEKGSELEEGWIKGRIQNIKELKRRIEEIGMTIQDFIEHIAKISITKSSRQIRYLYEIDRLYHSTNKAIKERKKNVEHKVRLLSSMYFDYLEHGFQFVANKYSYNKSRENLVMKFKRYVKEYDPTRLMKEVKHRTSKEAYEEMNALRKMPLDAKIDLYTRMYKDYKEHGFEFVKEKYDYKRTRNAMIVSFRLYAVGYVPAYSPRWREKNTSND